MPNFEQFPHDETSGSENPEHEAEDAAGVGRRLSGFVSRWRDRALAIALVAGAVGAVVKRRAEFEPAGRASEVSMSQKELTALDPEASMERVRLILETLPRGFVAGEIVSIRFRDERMPIDETYGLPKSEAAGTAESVMVAEGAIITFWKGMKGASSEEIWNGTILHEVAHANDWETDRNLDADDREELKRRVFERVQAGDRYRSSYVESISNPVPQLELETKAKEYWGEIVEAWLSGELQDPSSPDFALVQEYVAKNDPGFDRDAALAARQQVLHDMKIEKGAAAYRRLPQGERDGTEAWVTRRAKIATEGADLALQREGRKALVGALERLGTSDARRIHLMKLLEYYGARDEVFESRLAPDGYGVIENNALVDLAEAYDRFKDGEEAFGPDAGMARAELDEIIASTGIWIGQGEHAVVLQPGERDALGWTRGDTWSEHMLADLVGWHEAKQDVVQEYLDRATFEMPEEEEDAEDTEGDEE